MGPLWAAKEDTYSTDVCFTPKADVRQDPKPLSPLGTLSTGNGDAHAKGAHDGMVDARLGGVVRLGFVVLSLDRRLHRRHVVTTAMRVRCPLWEADIQSCEDILLRQELCRIPSIVKLMYSALWLVCRCLPCVLRDISVAHADR